MVRTEDSSQFSQPTTTVAAGVDSDVGGTTGTRERWCWTSTPRVRWSARVLDDSPGLALECFATRNALSHEGKSFARMRALRGVKRGSGRCREGRILIMRRSEKLPLLYTLETFSSPSCFILDCSVVFTPSASIFYSINCTTSTPFSVPSRRRLPAHCSFGFVGWSIQIRGFCRHGFLSHPYARTESGATLRYLRQASFLLHLRPGTTHILFKWRSWPRDNHTDDMRVNPTFWESVVPGD